MFSNLEGKPGRESPERTISTNGGLELLQMVLELVTGRCKTLVEVELDPLHRRRVLKTLRRSLKRTISASGGLERLQLWS